MSGESFKKKRDIKTIEVMIKIYCHGKHRTGVKFCPKCKELLRYAIKRINRCQLKERKTICAQCLVHCYTPFMREKIRDVMCYSGPRMMYKHPILTLFHLFDGLKPKLKSTIFKKNRKWLKWLSNTIFIESHIKFKRFQFQGKSWDVICRKAFLTGLALRIYFLKAWRNKHSSRPFSSFLVCAIIGGIPITH